MCGGGSGGSIDFDVAVYSDFTVVGGDAVAVLFLAVLLVLLFRALALAGGFVAGGGAGCRRGVGWSVALGHCDCEG